MVFGISIFNHPSVIILPHLITMLVWNVMDQIYPLLMPLNVSHLSSLCDLIVIYHSYLPSSISTERLTFVLSPIMTCLYWYLIIPTLLFSIQFLYQQPICSCYYLFLITHSPIIPSPFPSFHTCILSTSSLLVTTHS